METVYDRRINFLLEAATYYKDTNYCSVLSLAFAANISYAKALSTYKDLGRKLRQGVPKELVPVAFKRHGYSLENISRKLKSKTIKSFENLSLSQEETYILFTKRHVLTAKGSHILDWTKGGNHKILDAYRLHKIT